MKIPADFSSEDDDLYVDALVSFEAGRDASKRIWDSWVANASKSGENKVCRSLVPLYVPKLQVDG